MGDLRGYQGVAERAEQAFGTNGREAVTAGKRFAVDRSLTRGLADVTESDIPSATNVEIYTDNMIEARHDVERVLLSNSLMPLTPRENEATKRFSKIRGRAGIFHSASVSPTQVQYIAFVAVDQLPQVNTQLKEIRARQRVSQLAVTPSESDKDEPAAKPSPSTTPARSVAAGSPMESKEALELVPQELPPASQPTATQMEIAVQIEKQIWAQTTSSTTRRHAPPQRATGVEEDRYAGQMQMPVALDQVVATRAATSRLARANVQPLIITLNYSTALLETRLVIPEPAEETSRPATKPTE